MGGTAAEVLAEVVAELPDGGESRPGQIDMAAAVEEALATDRHLVVQAGTGTGKSLAYLIPAVLSGRTVVVATATKALQDQLDAKDLPFLADHLDEPVVWTVLKGRANYLCRQRLHELADPAGRDDPALFEAPRRGSAGAQIPKLVAWADTTASGDRAELDFEPDDAAWSALSVSSRECPGATKCDHGTSCFAEAARHAAGASSIVVVNLHLYALDLLTDGGILPDHEVVVIDEAHQLEDVLSNAAGIELTAGRFGALARNARHLVADQSVTDDIADLVTTFTRRLGDEVGRRLRRPGAELGDLLTLVRGRLERLRGAVDSSGAAGDERSGARLRVVTALGTLVDEIDILLADLESTVVWIEGSAADPVLRSSPLDVGQLLQETLWTKRTAVLTSATLPESLPDRLGLGATAHDRRDVDSPFDYGANGLLYCAMHLPDPRSDDFDAAAAAELAGLIDAAGGRTLGLFTSWRAVDAMAPLLADALPHRILTQRDLPKRALVEEFTADEESVLLATMGFWQGVDIPGSALSLVAIDRIPFPRPDEPLLEARRERARGAAFQVIDLPRAAILLAQGAGRLIRSTADRGVVAVLDRRLGTATYRWDLVRALPPMRRTRDHDEVVAFLRAVRADAEAAAT